MMMKRWMVCMAAMAALVGACGAPNEGDGADVDDVWAVDDTGIHDAIIDDTNTEDANTEDPSADDTNTEDVVTPQEQRSWSLLTDDWPAAFLAVAGTDEEVWTVGARHGDYPMAMRYRDGRWERIDVPHEVDLWWVATTPELDVFFSGSYGSVFRVVDGAVERMDTPALARQTVFGVWARRADDVYAVGGVGTRSGFVWHYDGERWTSLDMPADTPRLANGATAGLFKAWGDGQGTVWFVGAAGTVLRRIGDGPLERVEVPTDETLLTVSGHGDRVLAVGGLARGVMVDLSGEPRLVELDNAPPLQGVSVGPDGLAFAVGGQGAVFAHREDTGWHRVDPGFDIFAESLHAAWIAPNGALWAVGGNVISPALDEGVVLYGGWDEVSALGSSPVLAEAEPFVCPEELLELGSQRSVARRWNEQNLAAIRRDIPRPGVHARNLYHLSLAMFDAWAAFDDRQQAILVDTTPEVVGDRESARDEALSYAAYRVLTHRYTNAIGGERSVACFRGLMTRLGYDPDDAQTEGDGARAIGNRIGQALIDAFVDDGALEALDYEDPNYSPPNPALIVDEPGLEVDDPQLWQPLDLAQAITQNGIALEGGPHGYIGPHWGDVSPFAISRPADGAPYVETPPFPFDWADIGPWVVDVIGRTAWLNTADSTTMDASPGAYGNNPLGSDEGAGHPLNPVTGAPYAPQIVPRSDFGRVLAEYWADGPDSETPPGHWNTIANSAVDTPGFDHRLFGRGEVVEPLAYDVHLYLVLNGALHDAAIVAWEQKRRIESARPITLIRWMGKQGQSSDPELPSYHPRGLPLVDGLVELITEASTGPGERHAHLAAHVGEVALFSWPGAPGDHRLSVSPCQWMRAVEWVPYQPDTFVSPAFPGYISGHSTFSRAAAEVLTVLTGSAYFPGGLAEFVAGANAYLDFERGPSVDVRLQWATYFDAADQAGQSRIWGGIHVLPDDFDGRRAGAWVGHQALAWAEVHIAR